MEWTQERWDALAMNVELLVTLHGDNEKRMAQLMDLSNRMGRILEAHDITIDDLEARITDLENGKRKS